MSDQEERIRELAETLKKSGLAASFEDAYERAKSILSPKNQPENREETKRDSKQELAGFPEEKTLLEIMQEDAERVYAEEERLRKSSESADKSTPAEPGQGKSGEEAEISKGEGERQEELAREEGNEESSFEEQPKEEEAVLEGTAGTGQLSGAATKESPETETPGETEEAETPKAATPAEDVSPPATQMDEETRSISEQEPIAEPSLSESRGADLKTDELDALTFGGRDAEFIVRTNEELESMETAHEEAEGAEETGVEEGNTEHQHSDEP